MGTASNGELVPCYSPSFGSLGSDGCYYQLDTGFSPPAWDTADQPPPGQAGAFYVVTCLNVPIGTGGGIVWLPAGAAAAIALPPPPAVLALQATNRLSLPTLAIEASPATNADQLVGLPTWVWVSPSAWQPVSATASVPGESVTAVATPTSVTWNFGDGTSMVCQGPGTPYAPTSNPSAPSPTCGHTYAQSSAGQPNDSYGVTATVAWSVNWTGGGQSGTEPALQQNLAAAFRVAESQAINTASVGRN